MKASRFIISKIKEKFPILHSLEGGGHGGQGGGYGGAVGKYGSGGSSTWTEIGSEHNCT